MLRERDTRLLQLRHAADMHRVADQQQRAQAAELADLRATNAQLERHVQNMINSARHLDHDEQQRLQALGMCVFLGAICHTKRRRILFLLQMTD
jgi:hypothetical protein